MIKFEGFELQNTEDSIINRQPSTQPVILKQFMTALGAKEGSSSWEKKSFLTPEQQALHKKTLKGYEDLEYEGPGGYKAGSMKAKDLEGYRATSSQGLEQLQKEDKLSVSGIEQLRNLKASTAASVRPDVEGLRKTADEAWQGYDANLAETTRKARERLGAVDIQARRSGQTGGTALARLGARNVTDYGRTVGEAAARAVEDSAFRRQQLQLQGYGAAGQLGMQVAGLGAQGLRDAGQLELGQLGIMQGDLAQRRQIASGEKQFGATHGLNVAKFSEQQAQNQNLWAQQAAANKNQFALNRLSGMNTAATARTFKNIKNVKKGSAGLGGAVLSAGGAVLGGMYGGPAGARAGAQFGGALASSAGNYGDDPYASMVNAGVSAYGAMQQTPGGTTPPGATGTNVDWSGGGPAGGYGGYGGGMPSWYGGGQFQDPGSLMTVPQMADAYGAQGGTGMFQGGTGMLREGGGMYGSYQHPNVAPYMQNAYGYNPTRHSMVRPGYVSQYRPQMNPSMSVTGY